VISSALIAAGAVVVGVILGLLGNVISADRQSKQQVERENVAAGRGYARRADEHYRPHFDTVYAAARSINQACVQRSTDLGDIDALDRCIDHLECSLLTRPVALAATELRGAAVEYRRLLQAQRMLSEQMPKAGSGDPLNPQAGNAIADLTEKELQPAVDAALAATHHVREVVKAVVAQLEADQGMTSPAQRRSE
jgi:hypothetical protein